MGVENLKRWHWAIIGLLLGAAIGGSQVFWRDSDPGGDRTFDREQFEDRLDRGMAIRNLVLHPPIEGQQWVTGEAYKLKNGIFRNPLPQQRRMRFAAPTSQPVKWADGDWVKFPLLASEENSKRSRYDTPASAKDYLAKLAKASTNKLQDFTFKYAWWEEDRVVVGMYALGGLILLGGIWPSLVSVLTGGPLIGRRAKDPNEYDLDRFGKEPEPDVPVAAAVASDPDALVNFNQKLEEQVGDFMLTPTSNPDDSMAPSAESQSIRPLGGAGTASDPTAPAAGKDKGDDPRDYGGEFYPVAKPGGKPK